MSQGELDWVEFATARAVTSAVWKVVFAAEREVSRIESMPGTSAEVSDAAEAVADAARAEAEVQSAKSGAKLEALYEFVWQATTSSTVED